LLRESLQLQNIHLSSKAERLVWLSDVIPTFKGSGIVYAKTTSDCESVAGWLRENNIVAQAYYGSLKNMTSAESAIERQR
ncbi:MAG: ATP-dependent DNA helicase RecG, partial [Flavobacteriales bacterium]